MSTPFTIRIFVSDGDPEGIRIIIRRGLMRICFNE
jgi:hypothetical protein